MNPAFSPSHRRRCQHVVQHDREELAYEVTVYPHRINPLTTGPGLPRYIDGSRTLKGLRAQVRRTIRAFLIAQMNNGAFRTKTPSTAFFVDVSEELNTPTVIFAGKLIARVGLATN